jgi:hypothetical protein
MRFQRIVAKKGEVPEKGGIAHALALVVQARAHDSLSRPRLG